ncbi:MAG: bifunctional demethylmenaquinone methyltransferase/2-methoxy-6-polyprenyl-1,4-benzoquinol methylase UbiE [Planctomycetota bacterium]|nr:bifunctional demethylmenaquinone methyltransferase/2-methoxy-6-polyprenyl-1,4-benzoquinol methylase UbiE [Planctomycetota bacterium]
MDPHPTESPTPNRPAWSDDELRDDLHARSDKAGKVQEMFASIAASYDMNNRVHSFGLDRWWRHRVVRALSPIQGLDVVDVACGTGDLAEAFDRAGAGSVLGVDFTPEMLDIARARARRSRLERIEYREGDAMRLQLDDACADVVSIAFGIRNVAKPELALMEFKRILRPGGRLVILEFSEPTNPLIRWCNRLYQNQLMPRTAAFLARDRSGAYRYLPKSITSFMGRGELAAAIQAAGFSPPRLMPMTFGVCVAYLATAP